MTPDPHTAELALVAAGDEGAFARFLARAEAAVRGHLARFAAQVDTEAALQEAFLRAWQAAPLVAPDGKPDPLLRFTLRAARNVALDEIRRLRRVTPEEADVLERLGAEDEARAAAAPPDPLLRRLVLACVEALPEQPRRALLARLGAHGGTPDAALAGTLGMRKNTFLQNFGRARKLLAACLRAKGADLGPEAA